jgi:hypothetical protein
MRVFFFFAAGTPIAARGKWGKWFPQSQRIPVFFLMPRNGPRRQGKPGKR